MWWPVVWRQTNSCLTTGLKLSECDGLTVNLSLCFHSAALWWCSDNTIRWGVFFTFEWTYACGQCGSYNKQHVLCLEISLMHLNSIMYVLLSILWIYLFIPPPSCRWMKKPRCGVPDQIGGTSKFSVRKRRYALTGQKWQHKHITYRWVDSVLSRCLFSCNNNPAPHTRCEGILTTRLTQRSPTQRHNWYLHTCTQTEACAHKQGFRI